MGENYYKRIGYKTCIYINEKYECYVNLQIGRVWLSLEGKSSESKKERKICSKLIR